MNKGTVVLLLNFLEYAYYFWMITWIKNANKFEIAKFQPQGVA